MGRRTLVAVVTLALLTAPGCRLQALRHDPDVAAARAETFLRLAAIDRDFAAAHRMLTPEGQRRVNEAALAEAIHQQHPTGYPREVHATEYEPVPGQPAIQIFLRGDNGSEQFYYRVPLVGTVDGGYFPDGFFRGNRPYPTSTLRRKLK